MKTLLFCIIATITGSTSYVRRAQFTGTDLEITDEFYGSNSLEVFDIFIPDTTAEQPLVVFIHGGGFDGGDKSTAYNGFFGPQAQQFIDSGIAFAAINFELINIPDSEGMNKCLHDISDFHDFIIARAGEYHIDITKIAFYGNSSGGASSLWLSFNDSVDPLVVGSYQGQGTLDIVRWPEIFAGYGITLKDILKDYGIREYIYALFAVESKTELEAATDYRESVDLFALMDSTDAPFWYENNTVDTFPNTSQRLFHNPLHGKTLYDTAATRNLPSQFYLPAFSIADTANETLPEYFIRVLKE